MKNKCFSDEDLMKFADGELNNKEMSMDIINKVLEDSPEAEDVRKRLDQDVRVVGPNRVRDRIHRPEHRTHIRAFFSRDGIFLRSATESENA